MGVTISSGSGRGGGIVGKIVFSAFGLFFAFMGSMFVKQEWTRMQEIKAMQAWVQTPCTIESCKTEDHGEKFRLAITYSYSFGGKSFTGGRYGKDEYFTAESITEIKRAEKKLQPGKVIDGYCNPNHPEEAVLHLPTIGSAGGSLLFALIFPAIGILVAALPWLRPRKPGDSKTAAPRAKSPKVFLLIFGSFFALFGAAMLQPFLITPLQKSQAARTWNEVPAEVVSSKVKSHHDDDGTTYSPYIAYRYEINGTEYFGDQYKFVSGSSSGYQGKDAIVRQYPKGRKFTLFVNPVNPEESVIIRETGPELLFGLIPLLFTAIGIGILIGAFRVGKTSTRKLNDRQAHERVVELKGKSRIGPAVGIVLFATLWNGVVYLIYRSDAGLLFLGIFGFFGVVSILLAVKTILAIFNPRPTVEITPGDIRPGTRVALRWRMNGRIERISRLSVSLQCLKVTTETRRSNGKTQTSVVKKPLFEEELLKTDDPREMAQGTAQFLIPEDYPASRPGSTSGIQWQLIFKGDIPRWPDLKDELPFLVYPEASR